MWIADLNDGTTVFESPGQPGEMSVWQTLRHRVLDDKVQIDILRLQRNGLTVSAIPAKHCDGYFQAYETQMWMFQDIQRHIQGIGSVLGDKVFITWMDISKPEVWQEVRDFSTCRVHTTVAYNGK